MYINYVYVHINHVYVHKLCLCAHKLCLCNINIVYVIFVQTAFHKEELRFSVWPRSRPTHCLRAGYINGGLDGHKTVMKKFFKETTCTAVLQPVLLCVERETGPDKVCSDGIIFSNNVFH